MTTSLIINMTNGESQHPYSLIANNAGRADQRDKTLMNLTLLEIGQIGKALGDAADAISKFGDSVAHLIKLGAQGWDSLSARNAHARLIAMGVGIQQMRQSQQRVLDDLDKYIGAWNQDTKNGRVKISHFNEYESGWKIIRVQVAELLTKVQSLLANLSAERSDFVASDAYGELGMILNARIGLLTRLSESSPPIGRDEIEKLKEVQKNYRRLHEGLVSTLALVNNYLRDYNPQ